MPQARQFVLGCLPALDSARRDEVALMVSELVTNAIVYGMTRVEVTVDVGHELRIEVSDGGGGIPAMPPMPAPTNERGRGLRIVRALSDRWGVEEDHDRSGKCVWFELALPTNATPV